MVLMSSLKQIGNPRASDFCNNGHFNGGIVIDWLYRLTVNDVETMIVGSTFIDLWPIFGNPYIFDEIIRNNSMNDHK